MSKNINDSSIEKDSKGKSIYVKVSDETRDIIDNHKDVGKLTISQIIEDAIKLYDEYKSMQADVKAIIANLKGNHGGTAMKLIEKALLAFNKMESNKPETKDLWIQAREEMNMMLIGRTTFSQLIAAAAAPEESLDKPQKKNVGFDIILWYTEKPIKNLSLSDILDAIKVIWVMANWFYKIDVIEESKDQYHMIFKHHQNRRYSEYWGKYFEELLTSDELSFKVLIETQVFEETISLIIKIAFKK
ncbi:MAG: hypothetical protein ACFFAS_05830 [Promethearchaeota archaeon]